MNIDLFIKIKRNAESQNYQLNMLVINPSAIETNKTQRGQQNEHRELNRRHGARYALCAVRDTGRRLSPP